MTTRTHTIEKKNEQHNQEWSWDETPDVLAAIEQLRKSSEIVETSPLSFLNLEISTFIFFSLFIIPFDIKITSPRFIFSCIS